MTTWGDGLGGKFEVTFLGTGGSCAYNSGHRTRYGTNTPCVAVVAGDETLIFDSGTGICGFKDLREYQKERIRLFFSHYHIDHLSGLLLFSELFEEHKNLELYGAGCRGNDLYGVIDYFLAAPLHSSGIRELGAKLSFHTIKAGDVMELSSEVTVRTYGLSHTGGSIGYRVEYAGKALCYCTDVELSAHQDDDGLLAFTQNADLLIMDSFLDDGKTVQGCGHSSWRECAQWAKHADAKRLALFHHGLHLCDDDIDAMWKNARRIFFNTFAAADRMKTNV